MNPPTKEWESITISASTSRRKFKLFRLVENDSLTLRARANTTLFN